ncbi:hypothetical protein Dimus_012221 [Dionaea muscipula]
MAITNSILLLVFLFDFMLLSSYAADDDSIDFHYPAVFNFGDSNSDTGNLVAGLGISMPAQDGQTFFSKPSGRFCDGRLIVDFLRDAVGRPFLPAYLEAVGAPSFNSGCNFAAAGSTIQPANAASLCPFSFGVQVNQFLRFKARVLDLQSAGGKKYDTKLPEVDYFSKGIYMFDIGQNDLAGAFYSKTFDQILASIPLILAQFEAGLKTLYTAGARNFWIHNTGPLGCLAQNIARFGTDPSKLDELGCLTTHNQAAKSFNSQLHGLCQNLTSQYADLNITYVNIYNIKLDLIANYSQHGFEQPIMVCCGYGGPPLNYDSRVGCGGTAVLNGTRVASRACNDSSKYVNWDGIHYTDAANHFVASQILAGTYSESDRSTFSRRGRGNVLSL